MVFDNKFEGVCSLPVRLYVLALRFLRASPASCNIILFIQKQFRSLKRVESKEDDRAEVEGRRLKDKLIG